MSLKQQILNHLQEKNDWVSKAEIEKFAIEKGYFADTADRRLRELTEDGFIEKPNEETPNYRIKQDKQLSHEQVEWVKKIGKEEAEFLITKQYWQGLKDALWAIPLIRKL